ncbi:hypothetical protein BJV82DRAFT_628007 [Fennellomyces sp. T-0311]|nr:hypothetical protein BJV82DRAFT_628007 [Fennellomyces sp. T-0311]
MSQEEAKVVVISNTADNERSPLLATSSSGSTLDNAIVRDPKSEAIGLTLMAMCALAFSSTNIFVKLSGASFPAFEIVLARSAIQAIFGLVGTCWLGINPLGHRSVRPWLLFRGVIGGIALVANFFSITHLPLADATVIMYLNPTITTILAALLLKEPFQCFEGFCVTLCLAGAVLVTKPMFLFGNDPESHSDDAMRTWTIAAALMGAFFTAVAYIIIRKIGHAAHFLVHTIYFGCVGSLISLPCLFMFQTFVWPEGWREYGGLLMTGVSSFIGQCLLGKALQMAPAGPASIMRMNEVVLAFVFGVLIFKEYPDILSVAGAVIILVTTTVLGSRKWRSIKSSC